MLWRILNVVAAVVLVIWISPRACLERVETYEIGVRRSLEGGVNQEDFGLGYHVSLPFWHSWYKLNGTLHYLEFSNDANTALDVRTKENNIIFIDVTIPYRIKEGEGWAIVREGYADSYPDKVKSTAIGLLREHLANLSNLDVQNPDKRRQVANETLPILNEALAQYHVEATHIILRSIRFRSQYESKLQNKQFFVVQGRLDEAMKRESAAKQTTDTLEKTITKDIALKEEEWNKKIEELKAKFELEIATINAEAKTYARKKRADADAAYAEAVAEGNLAEAKAEALGEKLKAQALASKAGRTFSAIQAARNFQLGDITLNSSDPRFMSSFGSMKAWREFFMGQ